LRCASLNLAQGEWAKQGKGDQRGNSERYSLGEKATTG